MSSIQNPAPSHQIEDVNQYLLKRKSQAASFKSLSKRSLDIVIENFNELCAQTTTKSPQLLLQILDVLPADKVEHAVGAEYVHCEGFYERASKEMHGNDKCIPERHGLSWKRLFYEMLLCGLLSNGIGDKITEEELLRITKAIQDFVFTLSIKKEIINESLVEVFKLLPNLTKLALENDALLLQNSINARSLQVSQFGKALKATSCLCSLSMSNCELDDDFVRLLLSALKDNNNDGDIRNTLVHLDISHNRITTDGLRLLLNHFLPSKQININEEVDDNGNDNDNDNGNGNDNDNDDCDDNGQQSRESILATLNVSDNNIRSEGGRSLGRVLRTNSSLIELNISLNRLEDEGGKLLINGLRQNSTLQYLNLASNSLSSQTVLVLSKVLEEIEPRPVLLETNDKCDSFLEEIDLSSNNISDLDVERLAKAIQLNTKLVCLDLRCQYVVNETKELKPTQAFTNAIEVINERLIHNEKSMMM